MGAGGWDDGGLEARRSREVAEGREQEDQGSAGPWRSREKKASCKMGLATTVTSCEVLRRRNIEENSMGFETSMSVMQWGQNLDF